MCQDFAAKKANLRKAILLRYHLQEADNVPTGDIPTQAQDVEARSTVEQLRVTLTGPTDGGKSTLLGTLSTGIFDNGSGRSRTFLLRHRHELASGITTSLSHMLVGYKNNGLDENLIYSFSDRNIDSWEASKPNSSPHSRKVPSISLIHPLPAQYMIYPGTEGLSSCLTLRATCGSAGQSCVVLSDGHLTGPSCVSQQTMPS